MSALAYAGIGLVIALVLVLSYPYLYLLVRSWRETGKMRTTCLNTGRVVPEVSAVRDGHVNAFLIKTADGYIAIDAGQNAKVLEASLDELGARPEEVIAVFLTHTDPDHCGAIELLESARVHVAGAEEPLINGSAHRTFTKYRIKWRNKLPVPYVTLDDGEVVNVGERSVLCVLTPGHTPGSMSFLVDDRYLFTGDTVALDDGRFTRFVDLFTMDSDENVRSIHKLVRTLQGKSIEHVFSAHHGHVDDYERAAAGW